MKQLIKNKGREAVAISKNNSANSFYFLPSLGKLTLFSMLPAFIFSCTQGDLMQDVVQEVETKLSIGTDMAEIDHIDVFVFHDDKYQKLDCYQRIEDVADWNGTIASGSGERLITAIANCPYGRSDWLSMNSYSQLQEVTIDLEDEKRGKAFMAQELCIDTGEVGRERLALRPFVSEIVLKSLSCNFKGRPYEGEKLTDAKVYLINVNAQSSLLEEDGAAPRRIINSGRLCEEDVEAFAEPDLIVQSIDEEIGQRAIFPDIRLWCYQSNRPEEGPATQYTRLVIEGKVEGETYYWPININRNPDSEGGVWRNSQYSYFVTIRRKGSTDPNIPVDASDIAINQEVKPWKTIEEYKVSF